MSEVSPARGRHGRAAGDGVAGSSEVARRFDSRRLPGLRLISEKGISRSRLYKTVGVRRGLRLGYCGCGAAVPSVRY